MWLYILIGLLEFGWSWVSNQVNLSVVRRKPWKAGAYGLVSAMVSWAVPIWIYLYSQDWSYAVAAIVGDALGDFVAASRKQKRKKKSTPVNI